MGARRGGSESPGDEKFAAAEVGRGTNQCKVLAAGEG